MKLAISSSGNSLNANVDRRFGRCPWFLFVDTETLRCEVVENKSADVSSGAGTVCAQLVLEREVDAVVSGQVGPNAYEVLRQGEIKIFIVPQNMSIREALNRYKDNELKQMEMRVF